MAATPEPRQGQSEAVSRPGGWYAPGLGKVVADAPQAVFNADDFGRSPTINAAVLEAHRNGVLTSASLMVTGGAAGEAVAIARENPGLAVGLHLVLAGGRPALPPADIPRLLDASGRFRAGPAGAGARYVLDHLFSPAGGRLRRELALEIEAQFELFTATGLRLSHVDGHMHLHILPGVFDIVLPLAVRYGARAIRLPRDSWELPRCVVWRRTGWNALEGAAFHLCCNRAEPLAARFPALVVADRVYGVQSSGRMGEPCVVEALDELAWWAGDTHRGFPLAEFFFHPDTAPQTELLGPNPGDLRTLLSPAVRRAIEERGIRLTTFIELGDAVSAAGAAGDPGGGQAPAPVV